MSRSPLIVIGMHRSGTGLVSKCLKQMGVLVGRVCEHNNESILFNGLNRWILRLSGGTWEHPETVESLFANAMARDRVVRSVRTVLARPRAMSFLGPVGFLKHRTIENLDIPWGWKDPVNTYTLPFWLELFPRAKVMHVYRNGVDVASSLKKRSEKEIRDDKRWITWWQTMFHMPFPYTELSIACLELEKGFALWEKYTRQADRHMERLPDERTLAVRYEDLVRNPVDVLQNISMFAGTGAIEPETVSKMSRDIDASRAHGYTRDGQLSDFYASVKTSEQMQKYGY